MKHSVVLTIASLLSILFGTFHLADDIARGMSPGGLLNLVGIAIFVVWLYRTLVLAERRSIGDQRDDGHLQRRLRCVDRTASLRRA